MGTKQNPNDTPLDLAIRNGRGQVCLKDAIGISLGWALSTRDALTSTLLWGLGFGVLNALTRDPRFWPQIILSSLLIAAGISYLSMIPWRWRLVPKGTSLQVMMIVNGFAAFVLGYIVFYVSLFAGAVIFNGFYVLFLTKNHIIYSLVSFSGFVFSVVGYYIMTGMETFRAEHKMLRRQQRIERLMEEAQIVALRSQINPHFFFNALNTIAALIPERPRDAERAVELLAQALRPVLTREQRQTATLEQELAVAKAYGEIESLRFGDRVEIEYIIPDSLLDYRLPSLSVQPLLENAFRHGVSKTSEKCQILIEAKETEGHFAISIYNSRGGKFNQQNLDQMESAVFLVGHALHNIRARLKALFGEEAELDVRISESREQGFAGFTIPIEKVKPAS